MKKIEITMALYDNKKNRKKSLTMSPLEIMADDEANPTASYWNELDDFIEWGKSYKITIEEVE